MLLIAIVTTIVLLASAVLTAYISIRANIRLKAELRRSNENLHRLAAAVKEDATAVKASAKLDQILSEERDAKERATKRLSSKRAIDKLFD